MDTTAQSSTSVDSLEKPSAEDTSMDPQTVASDSGQSDREATMEVDETPQTSAHLSQPAGSKDTQLLDALEGSDNQGKQKLITLTVDDSKRYHCSECDVWAQGHAFEEHLMCHIVLRPYQCLYCSQCFVNRRDVTRHVMKDHAGKKMNCALRALKKARGLMKSALESGKYEFYACVAGKVPLIGDRNKTGSTAKKLKPTGERVEKVQASKPASSPDGSSANSNESVSKSDQTRTVENGVHVSDNAVKGSDGGGDRQNCVANTDNEITRETEDVNVPSDEVVYTGTTQPDHSSTEDSSDCTAKEAPAQLDSAMEGEDSGTVKKDMVETVTTMNGTVESECTTDGELETLRTPLGGAEKSDTGNNEVVCAQDESEVEQTCGDNEDDQVEIKHLSEENTERADAAGTVTDTENSQDALEESMDCVEVEPVSENNSMEVNLSADKETANEGAEQDSSLELQQNGFNQSEEGGGSGLKIVAAFSLQEEDAKEDSTKDVQMSTADSKTDNASEPPDITQEESTPSRDERLASLPPELGPPSKPIPSSSFLELPTQGQAITSAGFSNTTSQENFNFFVCGFNCSFNCLTSLEFRDHLVLDHAGEFAFCCFYCGYQSSTEDGLLSHMSAHANTYSKCVPLYICGASACKFGSNLVEDYIAHQSAQHPELTSFYCHDCDGCYDSVADVLKHFEANLLQVTNCPHCTAKSTNRRALLSHITTAHPGKPKMVSVAKQILCRDRRLNKYFVYVQRINQSAISSQHVTFETASSSEVVVLDRSGRGTLKTKSLMSILTEPIQPQERELTRQAAMTRNGAEMKSENTDDDEDEDCFEESFDDSFDEEEYSTQSHGRSEIAYMGSKADDKEADNFKCKFCTFIARDRCRLEGHERCHGLPPSRKSRFKCMYCPQGFNNDHKFNSHVSCHPGLIKFSLYSCKFCEFDSNQRHIIVKHVRSTRDQTHMSFGSSDEDLFTVVNKTIETRVLECTQCSYMTRHRKHLYAHLKREHSSPRKTGITVDCDIVENYSGPTLTSGHNKGLETGLPSDYTSSQAAGEDDNVRENQARRFKCPICQYLVPRAADLKAHVKRHSEIGEITLVMFRCKYCSAASTAREVIYGHLMEKHLGKQIALVKRIVTIDTRGSDNGYAVTSMEDEEDGQSGAQRLPQGSAAGNKMVMVIPDSAGETFQSQMPCPACSFTSLTRSGIIQHVSTNHPEVKIMGRRQDNEVYPLETSRTPTTTPGARITVGETLTGEILIIPDSQTFDEVVLCPKCDYCTFHRKNIIQHLEQNHPEVSVMGRNDYPTIDSKGKEAMEANATGKDGMVIIGSGSLDEKIRCLYENFGDRMRCMICQAERPKKFFMHVHILRHLNILLWGCQFCSHKGLQKYKMMDHIKKVHPNRAFCIRYLPVNVEERVNQYLKNASMIRARRSGEDAEVSPSKNSLPTSVSSEDSLNALRLKHKAAQDNLSGCTIGSEELDMKLACLYSLGNENRYHCVVCAQEFQRKFAVHRHIVQAHLKVNLIGCGYCDMEGVERHIMIDHILETHRSAPISMRNLAQDLENKVAEFLSHMTLSADDAINLSASDLDIDDCMTFKLPEPPQLPAMLSQLEPSSPPRIASPNTSTTSPRNTPSPHPSHSPSPSPSPTPGKNQLNPSLLLLGKDSLNKHLHCMFKVLPGPVLKYRCVVCRGVFDRKYAIHRHLLMKHLKKGIIGCPYCSFEGVERYQVFTHIKEDHKDCELRMQHLSVDMDSVVSEFMQNLANGTLDLHSKTPPPWSMKKIPKREVEGEESETTIPTSENAHGLVVAMFGGKRSLPFIKQEPMDEDDSLGQEPVDREVNGAEYSEDAEYASVPGEDGEREVSAMSLQAANGTKGKVATDVQTNIRVITVKEKGFKRHICEKCKFTSLHRSNIVRHIYRVHEQYREQECPACNYKTLSRVLIEQHMKSEHPDIPFPQPLQERGVKRSLEASPDGQEFDSMKKSKAAATSKRRDFTMSLLNSSSSQLYACAYCEFETMTHAEIVQHTRDNHSLAEPMKGQDDAVEVEDKGEEERVESVREERDDTEFQSLVNTVKMNQVDLSGGVEDSLWQCFYCSYKTSSEEDLKIHFADTHPSNVYRSKKIPTWRFVCRSCHVKTRAHSKMRYHLNRHINYRPYTCTTCGSFYPSPDQCRKHCRANNHNETFTYVKVPRKEKRLQELLKECQEIAMALTRNPGEADSSEPPTLSHPFPSKRKAKKSFPTSSPMRRNYEYDAPYSPKGASSSYRPEEQSTADARMICGICDFTAQNVCDVWLHFTQEHEGQEFLWTDSATGHTCTRTGEITNATEVPPDLEEPAGPGYSMRGVRVLSCHHCEFTTSTVQAMKSHLRRHMPKRYLCPYCSLRCSRSDTITQHVRCGHKNRELWTIFFHLPEGFTPQVNTSNHLDLEEPQVTFKTEDMEEQSLPLSSSSSPPPATASAALMERIGCGQCEMKLDSVAAVLEHHTQDHPELDFLWVDTFNGYTFNQSGEVIDAREHAPHLFTQDGFTVETDSGNVPTFCCKFCPFTSSFIQAIKSHMKTHLPHGFMCPYCCMATSSKEKMLSHQSCVHRGQESWVLHLRMQSEGGSSGGAAAGGEKNVPTLRQPKGVTNYTCSHCRFTSENLYQYRIHLANHGSLPALVSDDPGDAPLKCSYCGYLAEDEGDFGAHIASHLDSHNFGCNKCDYVALKRSEVESHILTLHSGRDGGKVLDLHAENTTEQGREEEDAQLVDLDPQVKVVPVNDLDLDREGLTLFSPATSPEAGVQEETCGLDPEPEDVDILGLEPDSGDDDQSDFAEDMENPPEVTSPKQVMAPPSGGGLLRLTLQGKLSGEYGIKRAVITDLNPTDVDSRVVTSPGDHGEDIVDLQPEDDVDEDDDEEEEEVENGSIEFD